MGGTERVNWGLLAAFRFLLAFVVVNHHLGYFRPSGMSAFIALFGGKAAVVGFLMISGFSISASHARAPERFMVRRFLRIYPAYFVAIVCAVAVQIAVGPYSRPGIDFPVSGPVTIVGNLLLVQSYLVRRIDFDPVVWSLSIEFSYYFLAMFLPRMPRWLWIAALAGSAAMFLWEPGASATTIERLVAKANMVRCLWPFLLGVLLHRHGDARRFLLAAILGAPLLRLSTWTPEALSTATYLLTLGALYLARRDTGPRGVALDYLGDVSYPLYLIHLPIFIACGALSGLFDPWLLTALSLAAATVIAVVIEAPFRGLLVRLGSFRIQHERADVAAATDGNADAPALTGKTA